MAMISLSSTLTSFCICFLYSRLATPFAPPPPRGPPSAYFGLILMSRVCLFMLLLCAVGVCSVLGLSALIWSVGWSPLVGLGDPAIAPDATPTGRA